MNKQLALVLSLILLAGCTSGHTVTAATSTTDAQATADPSPSPTDSPSSDSSSDDEETTKGAADGYKWVKIDSPCKNGAVRGFAVQDDNQDYLICEDGTFWQEQKK